MKAQSNKVQSACDVKVAFDGSSTRLAFPKRHSPLWELMDGKSLKGKPKYLYLGKAGFTADNPDDCKRAAQIAIAMESDLDHNEWDKLFDRTLEKYGLAGLLGGKYAKLADVLQLPGTVPELPEITVGTMWEAYLEWKKTTIEETTFKDSYQSTLSNAINGKKWVNRTRSFEQSDLTLSQARLTNSSEISARQAEIKIGKKRLLISALNEAFNFVKSKGLIIHSTTENPFDSGKFTAPAITTQQKYADKIVNGETVKWHEVVDEKALEDDRRAFTKDERDIIIKAFYESERLACKGLAPLIEFYFLTGCRTSEALPLTWKDVDFDRNLIRFSKSLGRTTNNIKSTKTNVSRLFYFPEKSRLKALLLGMKGSKTDGLIFPNAKGKYITGNAIKNAWLGWTTTYTAKNGTQKDYAYPGIVSQLVRDGLISGYLSPYHCRHTYITLTAQANSHNTDALLHIATSCGNSVDVILRHYLGIDESVELVVV